MVSHCIFGEVKRWVVSSSSMVQTAASFVFNLRSGVENEVTRVPCDVLGGYRMMCEKVKGPSV